jgi:hypothetical protein
VPLYSSKLPNVSGLIYNPPVAAWMESFIFLRP